MIFIPLWHSYNPTRSGYYCGMQSTARRLLLPCLPPNGTREGGKEGEVDDNEKMDPLSSAASVGRSEAMAMAAMGGE